MNARISTFAEFWPHYLLEHPTPRSRALHFTGTVMAIVLLAVGVVTANGWMRNSRRPVWRERA